MRGARLRGAALLLSAALTLLGCAVGERLITPRGDYHLYRESRVAEREVDRLGAANSYLKHYPNGRYRDEVAAWFAQAEPRFVQRAHDHPSMLRAYLEALPDGPLAPTVRDRLTELEIHREYQRSRAERERRKLARVTSDLGDAVRSRQVFVRAVGELVVRAASLRAFGLPLARAEKSLLREFENAEGELECGTRGCVKTFLLDYFVPANSRFLSREVALELSIVVDRGVIRGAELGGVELFSRLGEAVDRRALSAESLADRVDAVARAVQAVQNALESGLPAAHCEREPIAPVVLSRDCRGVRVEMRAGLGSPPRDVIQVMPSRSPPMP